MGDSGGSPENKPKAIHWTEMLEEYFASTGEKAHCLSWCHKRAEAMFSNRKTWIDLPVIVISGVTGFLSAGSTSMFSNPTTSSIALGVASLFVSVLNTAGSYYGWAKRSEGHRISAIHYARLYRFISVELALPRDERMQPNDFLKYVKDQYDRLQEISPLLPPEVIAEFQTKFANETEISKPEEANGLEKITVYRNDVNLDVSDPGDSRTPTIKMRTPKLAKAAGAIVAAFQESKRTLPTEVKSLVENVKHSVVSENPIAKKTHLDAFRANPLFRAAQLAKKVSPDILGASAPAPPPVEDTVPPPAPPPESPTPVEAPPPIEVPSPRPSSGSSDLEVIVEEEAKPSS
jgi:hypothetical protein